MKATELMISDWVMPRIWDADSTPIKIVGIRYNSYRGKNYIDWVDYEVWEEIDVNDIKPIPLTPEILEKNGFKGEGYLVLDLDEFSYLEYYPFEGRLRKIWHGIDEWDNHSDTKDITFQCHCKNVHELQHALRLCGLNDMANNFKV